MTNALIQFINFSFQYQSQEEPTLKNINLEIFPGEKILILGPSGSGKSTLGQCINGLIPNQYKGTIQGDCLINGKSIKSTSIFELSKDVGTVLQDSDAQFVGLSVGEDIAFVLENQARPKTEMIELVSKAAQKVGVHNQLDLLPYSLSGGQKQRASIAGILHEDIEVLLLDEPLAALDPHMGQVMIELVDDLNKNEGKTIVLIEHRLEEVLHRPIDRIVLMNKGEIVAVHTPDELLNSSLLSQYGIREPLYLSALKHLYGGLNQTQQLTSLDTIDLSAYQATHFTPYLQPVEQVSKASPIIQLQNIQFGYGTKPLISIDNLTIHQGERIALVGHNGSGKTTFAKLLTGVVQPQSGQIIRQGNPTSIQEIGQLIGYVMQNPNQMLVTSTVLDEVQLALNYRQIDPEEKKRLVQEALEVTGLYSKRHWPISALSYGQKKRLSVASVLVTKPKCLILDEPTAGQDYAHYRDMMEFINRLNRNHGITIIFITHDMHLALEYTDRGLVMESGKIIADDVTLRILDNDDLIERASLKKTSIFNLAHRLNQDIEPFVHTFIYKEGEVAQHG